MGKLVQANSIPFVIGGFSDITPEGERVLSLDLLNRGVGPAKQRSLRVKVDDRYVTSVDELLTASLGPEQAQAARKPLAIASTTATAQCSKIAGTFPASGKSPSPSTNVCATNRTNSRPDVLPGT